MREIVVVGTHGGPLAPLADQLSKEVLSQRHANEELTANLHDRHMQIMLGGPWVPMDLATLKGPIDSHDQGNTDRPTSVLPVTIYLSDEETHQRIENAIEALLSTVGLQIETRDDPVVGSWFRRMLATAKEVAHSPAAHEAALVAAHAADARFVLAQDATVTATMMQNLGPVLGALQPTKDAVIRVGALLIVKVDWVVHVFQLTAAQQATLDHRPQLARSPHEIIASLNLTPEDHQYDDPPALH